MITDVFENLFAYFYQTLPQLEQSLIIIFLYFSFMDCCM